MKVYDIKKIKFRRLQQKIVCGVIFPMKKTENLRCLENAKIEERKHLNELLNGVLVLRQQNVDLPR